MKALYDILHRQEPVPVLVQYAIPVVLVMLASAAVFLHDGSGKYRSWVEPPARAVSR